MDTIKCPACGIDVAVGTENCPVCGAPVGAIADNNISGVPIDNHSAIDNMLQNASRLVEESAALGIDLNEMPQEAEEESEEEFQRYEPNEPPPEISENQKNAMEGSVINISPGKPSPNQGVSGKNKNKPPKKAPKEKTPKGKGSKSGGSVPPPAPMQDNADSGSGNNAGNATLYELDDEGNPVIPDEKNKKPKKEKKEKKEKPKKQKASKGSIVIAALVSLVIGLAGGYFGKMFLFSDLPSPSCQDFAKKAVTSVQDAISDSGKTLHVAEAYVKDFSTSRQCIFRAYTGENDSAESKWYRVKVDNDDAKTIYIYLQIDMEEYERLKNSDNSEDQVNASMLMSIQNETDRCIEEARDGTWDSANAILLNNVLNPYKLPVE